MDAVKKFIHRWVWVMLIIYCVVGVIYPEIGIAALICMLAPSVVAIFKGRMWCGHFCPRGSFNDTMLQRLSRKKSIPKLFRAVWFRLVLLAVVMGAFVLQMMNAWGSYIDVSFVFVRMIVLTTGITILLGMIYHQRTWCMICPMGTMAHYVAKLQAVKARLKHITFNQEKCVGCKACNRHCPIGIDVLDHKDAGKVSHADCLKCKVCIEKCPKKSLYMA